jgi:hypothetical protein
LRHDVHARALKNAPRRGRDHIAQDGAMFCQYGTVRLSRC